MHMFLAQVEQDYMAMQKIHEKIDLQASQQHFFFLCSWKWQHFFFSSVWIVLFTPLKKKINYKGLIIKHVPCVAMQDLPFTILLCQDFARSKHKTWMSFFQVACFLFFLTKVWIESSSVQLWCPFNISLQIVHTFFKKSLKLESKFYISIGAVIKKNKLDYLAQYNIKLASSRHQNKQMQKNKPQHVIVVKG